MAVLTCPVESIEHYNDDTRRVLLKLPEPVDFHAGQYLQMVLPEKKYPFSIASSPRETRTIELHIRPTAGSEDSDRVESLLDTASEIDIEVPLGECFISQAPTNTLILMAASTGITQMKSIIEFLIATGFTHPIYLYWGVLSDRDLYLTGLCEKWQNEHDNIHFVPVVSEPETSPEWQGRTGLVGEAVLEDFDDLSDVTVVVSGGPAMVYATLDAFVESGMPEENMSSDTFSYAPRP